MSDYEFSEWQELYLEAMLEVDSERQFRRVHVAEIAIFLRLQELRKNIDEHLERHAVQDALKVLLELKTEQPRTAHSEKIVGSPRFIN